MDGRGLGISSWFVVDMLYERPLRAPVWSTWARFKMDVCQSKVEAYANEIASRAFPRSHLEVTHRAPSNAMSA